MTTDELLGKLPALIGRNPIYNTNHNVIAYISDHKPGGCTGNLHLVNDGEDWCASYGTSGHYVCLNPDSQKPPYDNALFYGKTPNEALQGLYNWCVKNGFIKD